MINRNSDVPLVNAPSFLMGRHEGFVLVISLLILTLLTIIGVAMSRSLFLQEGMAGNMREKIRAINSAQSALQQAEWWLLQGSNSHNNNVVTGCSGAGLVTVFRICPEAVTINTTQPLLSSWTSYTPNSSEFSVSSIGGRSTYYANPGVYIRYISSASDGSANFYNITAYGFGGNANAVGIVESFYEVDFNTNANGSEIENLGGL